MLGALYVTGYSSYGATWRGQVFNNGQGRAWNENAYSILAQHPLLGLYNDAPSPTNMWSGYDSRDRAVIRQHIAWARQAGIQFFAVDLVGLNDYTYDAALVVADECRVAAFPFCLNLELAYNPTWRPSLAELAVFVNNPMYYRIAGRPVINFFGSDANLVQGLVAERAIVRMFTGRLEEYLLPGYDRRNACTALSECNAREQGYCAAGDPVLCPVGVPPNCPDSILCSTDPATQYIDRRNGATFRDRLGQFYGSPGSPDAVIFVWNDFIEGDEIEPSVEFGSQYLAVCQQYLAGRGLLGLYQLQPGSTLTVRALSSTAGPAGRSVRSLVWLGPVGPGSSLVAGAGPWRPVGNGQADDLISILIPTPDKGYTYGSRLPIRQAVFDDAGVLVPGTVVDSADTVLYLESIPQTPADPAVGGYNYYTRAA